MCAFIPAALQFVMEIDEYVQHECNSHAIKQSKNDQF